MTLKQKLKKLNMGALRVHFFRIRMDLSVVSFIIITYVGFKQGLDWRWVFLVPVYLLYKIRDVQKYMTQEIDYNFRKSRMSMQMYRWTKENNEMLKKMNPTGDELIKECHEGNNKRTDVG